MQAAARFERRRASEADIPFLLALRRQTMQDHLAASGADNSEEAHLARVMYQFGCAEILLVDGKQIGLLKLARAAGEWEIIQIQLDPAFHGRGLGRSILEDIISDATTSGVSIKLGVLKANPAMRLYERLGFRVVGEDAHEFFMRRAP